MPIIKLIVILNVYSHRMLHYKPTVYYVTAIYLKSWG